MTHDVVIADGGPRFVGVGQRCPWLDDVGEVGRWSVLPRNNVKTRVQPTSSLPGPSMANQGQLPLVGCLDPVPLGYPAGATFC